MTNKCEAQAHASSLGQRLRDWRIVRGFTLEQVAQKIGVTQQQVQKYETGKNKLSVYRLEQIAALIEVPMAHFIAPKEPDMPSNWMSLWYSLQTQEKRRLAEELVVSVARANLR